MRNFEVFEPSGSGSRSLRGLFVTVAGRGSMSFSEDAWAVLGAPEAIRFLVEADPRARVVGFEACGRGDLSSHAAMGTTRTVRAGLLLKSLGYNLSETRRYTLRTGEGLPPYIDLDEDAPVVAGKRISASS